MQECYEYLGCTERNCKMHGINDVISCWEIEGTLCNHHGIELVGKQFTGKTKEEICIISHCIYYRTAKSRKKINVCKTPL